MNITVLGIGGFDNSGFPFNSFIIDNGFLVETPPDIIQSLKRESIELSSITDIFISHTHGDHIFGIPFLLFNMYRLYGGKHSLRIIGPKDVEEYVYALTTLAIKADHPYIDWIREACRFEVVDSTKSVNIRGYRADFSRLFHQRETYSIGLYESGTRKLQYIPDTRWDNRLLDLFRGDSGVLICDINGTNGNSEVHMSICDIEKNVPENITSGVRIIGTHICNPIETGSGRVEIATVGMRIII